MRVYFAEESRLSWTDGPCPLGNGNKEAGRASSVQKANKAQEKNLQEEGSVILAGASGLSVCSIRRHSSQVASQA